MSEANDKIIIFQLSRIKSIGLDYIIVYTLIVEKDFYIYIYRGS